ncbi:MAG: DedA family protein [Patescibacteria group bacterium]|nr:DedA family protein [Patescibacteria group bacterium]
MLDPITIIKTVGVIGVFLIIFTETGLFFGFFLPGDTLLFTAGIFASQGFMSLPFLIIISSVAAILGDTTGYMTGKHMGRKLFERDAGFFFKKKRLKDAEDFYEKHGKYTIIIARFIPMIRTFGPIVAGIGKMRYKTFITYNIIGGIFWTTLMLSLGYFLGTIIPNPDKYILPVIFLIVVISFMPLIFKILTSTFKRNKH